MDACQQQASIKPRVSVAPDSTNETKPGSNLSKGSSSGRSVVAVSPQDGKKNTSATAGGELSISLENLSIKPVPVQVLLTPKAPDTASDSSESSTHSTNKLEVEEPSLEVEVEALSLEAELPYPAIDDNGQTLPEGYMEQINSLVGVFHRNPSEESFNQLEQLIDQHIAPDHENKNFYALVIARIAEKYDWPITSSTFGDLACEILEGTSDLAKDINSQQMGSKKIDMSWANFFVTGEDTYLKELTNLIKPMELVTSKLSTGGELKSPKACLQQNIDASVVMLSFVENLPLYQEVEDFAVQMSQDSSLSPYQREFFQSISSSAQAQQTTSSSRWCNIL